MIKGENAYFKYVINSEKFYIKIIPKIDVLKLKIIPIADIHIGARVFEEKKFLDYLKFIKEEPVLCYLGGDIMEMAISDSPGGAIFEQIMRPKEQMLYALDKLRIIKDKIIFSEPGNHEDRSIKKVDIDPMFWILSALGMSERHFSHPLTSTIDYCGHSFNFFVQHGITSARTEGGKINAASNPSMFYKYVNFFCMGHVHDSHQAPMMHYRWELGEKKIFEKYIQYIIITPAFYGYWGSYAAKAAWKPPSQGAVVPRLYKDGHCDVSS